MESIAWRFFGLLLLSFAVLSSCDSVGRPSEDEVIKLFESEHTDMTAVYVTFGQSFKSSGGTTELAVGAPHGTTIYPVEILYSDPIRGGSPSVTCWVFKDSFGKLRCEPAPQ